MLFLNSILFLWVFYYLFVIVMAAYRMKLKNQLNWFTWFLFAPAIVVGFIADVVCQYTFATLYFWDLPVRKEYLVTDRLQRYMKEPTNKRYKRAKWLCENLLDPIDPTGKHC